MIACCASLAPLSVSPHPWPCKSPAHLSLYRFVAVVDVVCAAAAPRNHGVHSVRSGHPEPVRGRAVLLPSGDSSRPATARGGEGVQPPDEPTVLCSAAVGAKAASMPVSGGHHGHVPAHAPGRSCECNIRGCWSRSRSHPCLCVYVCAVCHSPRFQKLYSVFRPEYTWWRLVLLYVEPPGLHVLHPQSTVNTGYRRGQQGCVTMVLCSILVRL